MKKMKPPPRLCCVRDVICGKCLQRVSTQSCIARNLFIRTATKDDILIHTSRALLFAVVKAFPIWGIRNQYFLGILLRSLVTVQSVLTLSLFRIRKKIKLPTNHAFLTANLWDTPTSAIIVIHTQVCDCVCLFIYCSIYVYTRVYCTCIFTCFCMFYFTRGVEQTWINFQQRKQRKP